MATEDLPAERNIPILPCRSIDDQLAFYEAIGFEVTYRQKAPNLFAAVRRGPIELQFFTMKGYEPANSYSTCYVLTADVDRLYADFRDGLKAGARARAEPSHPAHRRPSTTLSYGVPTPMSPRTWWSRYPSADRRPSPMPQSTTT
jgi:hypothetical protein